MGEGREGAEGLLRKVMVSSGQLSAPDNERAVVVCFPGRDHAREPRGLLSIFQGPQGVTVQRSNYSLQSSSKPLLTCDSFVPLSIVLLSKQ